jgi:hypothetical protein
VAQHGDDPSLCEKNRLLDLGLVARLPHARRNDGDAVVASEIGVRGVEWSTSITSAGRRQLPLPVRARVVDGAGDPSGHRDSGMLGRCPTEYSDPFSLLSLS